MIKLTKLSKKNKPKQVKKTSKIKIVEIYKDTYTDIATFWRPLLLIMIAYAVLYIVFVLGFNLIPSSQDLQDQVSNYVGDSAGLVLNSATIATLSLFSSSNSDATVLIQYLLFIVVSLALIYAFRKMHKLQKIKINEAYYYGNANIVPVLLVTAMLSLCLLPVGIGGVVLAVALQYAVSGTELIIATLAVGVLVLISAYLVAIFWPAFYISSLPGTKPLYSMRTAAFLTKKRRFRLLGIFIVTTILLFIVFFAFMIPFAMVLPRLTPLMAYFMLGLFIVIAHTMLYTIYRKLINESKS